MSGLGLLVRHAPLVLRGLCRESSACMRPALPSADLCCQTGCPRCVFVVFAEQLIAYCDATGRDPISEVKAVSSDANTRAVLLMLVKEARWESATQ